jgi:rhamnosyltransferase
MDECASVIVTYFPDTFCFKHIERLTRLCALVIIMDNTPSSKKIRFPVLPNLIVHKFAENIGLAKGLNKGIELAGAKGFENIFLFDQDSYVPESFFSEMLRFKSDVDGKLNHCAIYVPDFWDRNSESSARFPILSRFSVRHASCRSLRAYKKNTALIAITSGNLITYSAYRQIGHFNESYFIDFLDNEYCLRVHKLGFEIAVNCNIVLDHSIGKRSKHRLFGLTIKPNHHNAVRRYYVFRNGIRTAIDYFRYYPSYSFLLVARFSHEILSILIYEDEKPKKIQAIGYGIYHGLIGRMGKCPLFQDHDTKNAL